MEQNPTKKCSECQMDISMQAKKCPHCQSKVKQPTSPVIKILLVIMVVGIFSNIIISSAGGGLTTSTQAVSTLDYKGSARAYAELYISKLLKSPSTADFCRGTVTDLGESKYNVSSCVDSQNSYGATLRSNWEAVMVYTGGDPDNIGSWKPGKITFDGKVIH